MHSAASVARSRASAGLAPVASTAPARSVSPWTRAHSTPGSDSASASPSAGPVPSRKRTQAPPTRRFVRSRFVETTRAAQHSLPPGLVAAPDPSRELEHLGAARPDDQLRDRRSLPDAERPRRTGRGQRRLSRVRALPDVGERRAVGHGQRVEDAVAGERAHGHDRLLDQLLDESKADPRGSQGGGDRSAQLA